LGFSHCLRPPSSPKVGSLVIYVDVFVQILLIANEKHLTQIHLAKRKTQNIKGRKGTQEGNRSRKEKENLRTMSYSFQNSSDANQLKFNLG
jgi:hypothetical protein